MKTIKRLLCLLLCLVLLMPAAGAEEGVLILPAGTRQIEADAFFGASGFYTVIVPEGAVEIGDAAFAFSSVREAILPESLEVIADNAFLGCGDMTVTAPEGSYAWLWAQENGFLLPGDVDADPAHFTYEISGGKTTVTGYIGDAAEISVPAQLGGAPVTAIGMGAFQYCGTLVSVTLPDTLETIGTQSFAGCFALRSVNIPAGVTSLGIAPFQYCNALCEIRLDSANENYRLVDGVLLTADGKQLLVYPNGDMRTGYTVPAGVERIEDEAFYGNEFLTAITLPEGLKEIGGHAFYGMHALEAITLPASLTTLGDGALGSCGALKTIGVGDGNLSFAAENGVLYNADKTALLCYPAGKNAETFTVPNGVTKIGASAFESCPVSAVILPESLTALDDFAFVKCDRLKR